MSLKSGKIRTETRSWRPKFIIGHYFCNMRITIEQNGQFHVGIYHEKIQLDQIQNGRPAAISDFNMCNNWKTVPDS